MYMYIRAEASYVYVHCGISYGIGSHLCIWARARVRGRPLKTIYIHGHKLSATSSFAC